MQDKFDKPRVKAPSSKEYHEVNDMIKQNNLHTVCQEAACPNIGECWEKKHATFMILGSICTRACRFCNVATGKPMKVDEFEPEKVANSVKILQLKHVVITSVDRDDLEDGGADHFAKTIKAIRHVCKDTTIEILTPDFLRKNEDITVKKLAIDFPPDVYNHNIETVPSLYPEIRPGARYFNSLNLLSTVKKLNPNLFTKSGLMVGLGEEKEEILQLMDDLRAANVDFITIGQYLQPTKKHAEVKKYYTPDEFRYLERMAWIKGFSMVSASSLTRSSYHAGDDFEKLRQNRINLSRK